MLEEIVIRAAAVSLFAFALTRQDCPFQICLKLRERFPKVKPLRCPMCAAFWLGMMSCFIPVNLLWPFAVAGLAVFLISFFVVV